MSEHDLPAVSPQDSVESARSANEVSVVEADFSEQLSQGETGFQNVGEAGAEGNVFESAPGLFDGVELEDSINNDRVIEMLMENGIRFSQEESSTLPSGVSDENGNEIPASTMASYLGSASGEVFKLYDKEGNVVELDSSTAIKTVDGRRFLVQRDPEHTYEFSEMPKPVMERGNPLKSKKENDNDKDKDNARQNSGGGFSLFPFDRGGRSAKATGKANTAALAAANAMGGIMADDLTKANELLDSIMESGGPLAPGNEESMRRFTDAMDSIKKNFHEAVSAGISSEDLPQFDQIKELTESITEKAAGLRDFLFDGKELFNSDAINAMKEGVREFISQLASTFSAENN